MTLQYLQITGKQKLIYLMHLLIKLNKSNGSINTLPELRHQTPQDNKQPIILKLSNVEACLVTQY